MSSSSPPFSSMNATKVLSASLSRASPASKNAACTCFFTEAITCQPIRCLHRIEQLFPAGTPMIKSQHQAFLHYSAVSGLDTYMFEESSVTSVRNPLSSLNCIGKDEAAARVCH